MPGLPIFITGNQHKADYVSRQLGVALEHHHLGQLEIQSTNLHDIVAFKLKQAYDVFQRPVLVEDVGLIFNALGDLPGPYIKWFLEQAGDEACCRMLNGFSDRSAVVRCTFGYYDGQDMTFFDSECSGKIAHEPRGSNGYGFDRIFIQTGFDITRAEMDQAENERTYAENIKPFADVRKFLNSNKCS